MKLFLFALVLTLSPKLFAKAEIIHCGDSEKGQARLIANGDNSELSLSDENVEVISASTEDYGYHFEITIDGKTYFLLFLRSTKTLDLKIPVPTPPYSLTVNRLSCTWN